MYVDRRSVTVIVYARSVAPSVEVGVVSSEQMGARVGILDADIYGPSLPTMISPELRVLKMDPVTRVSAAVTMKVCAAMTLAA